MNIKIILKHFLCVLLVLCVQKSFVNMCPFVVYIYFFSVNSVPSVNSMP